MASEKILSQKQETINEIKDIVNKANSIILFDYRGITDNEAKELRTKLRESNSDYRVYKNTLMARAFKDLNIELDSSLVGPSALAFGEDQVLPVKILNEFAKKHAAVILKAGVVDGKVTEKDELGKLALLPSRDGLLTMLAGSMIGLVKDLSISLDLYAKQKEEN